MDMQNFDTQKLKQLAIIFLILPLLTLFTEKVESYQNNDQFFSGRMEVGGTEFMAFVVPKSASGYSYWEERDDILNMTRLESDEEIQAFIQRYEPGPDDQLLIRQSLSSHGLTIVAQDNLFTIVTGTADKFAPILGDSGLHQLFNNQKTGDITKIPSQEFQSSSELENLVEGLILSPLTFPAKSPTDWIGTPTNGASIELCSLDSIEVDAVARSLKLDRVHLQGWRGQGVDIGFIDQGLYEGHPFFSGQYAADMTFYEFHVTGQVQTTSNTFDPLSSNGHGFMVAAYLAAAAPDARFHAFAKPTGAFASDNYIAAYLVYMRQHDLVDIFSLSQGWAEEDNENNAYLPEIRTEFINLIANNTIVLVAAGNAGQNINGFTSGHNALAAIPEVIAVGGSTLIPSGQGFTFEAAGGYTESSITGAASFDSILFPGRHIPDIVGVFGPTDLCYPWPNVDYLTGYQQGIAGTSGATPQMAGIAALLKQRYPSLSQSQMRAMLQNNAFDILTGESGDGDPAGPGYDAATGYGIPMATWALQAQVPLENGWNLIGVTTNQPYTAVGVLNEMYSQGGSCDYISYWSTSHGSYRSVVVLDDGSVFGQDFDIEPDMGYWVRCQSKFIWTPGGNGFISQPQPLQFQVGWNGVAIPYSEAPCTSNDLYQGTSQSCYRILRYDGMMQETQLLLTNSGRNFLLHPGEGYLVYCDTAAAWTPVCSATVGEDATLPTSFPTNTSLLSSRSASRMAEQIERAKEESQRKTSDEACPLLGTGPYPETNITEQQFTVRWQTTLPCMGSVVILDGQGNPVQQAFDDRGINFSGTTHHITVRGLEPNSSYIYGIWAGDSWYDAYSDTGLPFNVTTGSILSSTGRRYNFYGAVNNSNGDPIRDGYIDYIMVGEGSSDRFSYPLGTDSAGFLVTLDNMRDDNGTTYFNFTTASQVAAVGVSNAGATSWIWTNIDLPNSPSVAASPITIGRIPPRQPGLQAPAQAAFVMTRRPSFRFKTVDANSNNLTYRLEISTDDFATVAYTYDQRLSTEGWSASSYASDEMALFQVPEPLDNLAAYQWRVFAYDGQSWSDVSEIRTFSILNPISIERLYLPVISNADTK